MDAVRILVAEDNPLTREMIVECIAAERDMRVIGTAANGQVALVYLQQEDSDVLILDIVMPRSDAMRMIVGELSSSFCRIRISPLSKPARTLAMSSSSTRMFSPANTMMLFWPFLST